MDRALYDTMADVEDRHWWFAARREIIGTVLDRVPRPEGDVLEVGCGTGGNLAMLARYAEPHGQLFACEMDDAARAHATARGLAPIAEGHLPNALPFGDRAFALTALLDVLEHVRRDVDSLVALRERLVPGGLLLVTVPAYPFLWSAHDEANHHVRRYTRRPLVRKMKNAGFSIAWTTYFNTLLFPAIAAVRLGQRLRKDEARGSDLALPPPRANAGLRRLFAAERKLLPYLSLPFGLSLLVVGRKG